MKHGKAYCNQEKLKGLMDWKSWLNWKIYPPQYKKAVESEESF